MTKDNGELIVVSMLHPLRTALRWYNSYAVSRDALDFTIQKNLCIQKLMKLKIYSTQYDSMDTFDPRSRSRYFGVGTGVRPSELDSAPPRSSKLRFYFHSITFAIFAYLIPESYSQWEP